MLGFLLKKNMNTKGFTLIELIITLAILAIVVGPISGYFLQGAKMNAMAKNKLIANQIAQRYIEKYVATKSGIQNDGFKVDANGDPTVAATSDYYVKVDVTQEGLFGYPAGNDVIPGVDFNIAHNDNTIAGHPNGIYINKGSTTEGYIATGGTDAAMNILIKKSPADAAFTSAAATPVTILSTAYSSPLVTNPNVSETEFPTIEVIRVEVNTNRDLTLNVTNQLTQSPKTKCMIYIVRKKDSGGNIYTGKVFVNTILGKVVIVENLYDSSIVSGLPDYGLYKIIVNVYKGNAVDATKLLCKMESLMK